MPVRLGEEFNAKTQRRKDAKKSEEFNAEDAEETQI